MIAHASSMLLPATLAYVLPAGCLAAGHSTALRVDQCALHAMFCICLSRVCSLKCGKTLPGVHAQEDPCPRRGLISAAA